MRRTDFIVEGWSKASLPIDPRPHEMRPGEIVTGSVVRMPRVGMPSGNRLFVATATGLLALPATAKTGHAILARELGQLRVDAGDRVEIVYHGMRETQDAKRRYRLYRVRRV